MEKCTFCTQRIRFAKEVAKKEGRKVRDGEFQTACQQTCPTKAIVFGDLNDPNSKVSRLTRTERGYHVLDILNTRPSITYLTKIRNKENKEST
jgi:molybdopterin-containing oxidoreductase family iron-sulfur binding subunit